MIVAGWADGYRNNTFRTVDGARRGRHAVPAARRSLGARRPDDRDARPADRPRPRDGRLVGPLAARPRTDERTGPGGRLRPHLDRPGAGPRAARRGSGCRGPWPVAAPSLATLRRLDGPRTLAVEPDVGTAAWIDCAGHLPWGLSGDQRDDDAHSLTWEWDAAAELRRRAPGRPAAGQRRRAGGVALGQALRRLPRRHLGADHPRHARPAFRDGLHDQPRAADPRRGVRRRARRSTPAPTGLAPGHRLRLSVAGADWPNTVAPPGPGRRSPSTAASWTLPLWPTPGADPPVHGPAPSARPRTPPTSTGRSPTTSCAAPRPARCATVASTTCPHDGHRAGGLRRRGGVDRRTFAQQATRRDCTYRLTWPGHRRPGRLDACASTSARAARRDHRRRRLRRRGAGRPPGVARAPAALTRRELTRRTARLSRPVTSSCSEARATSSAGDLNAVVMIVCRGGLATLRRGTGGCGWPCGPARSRSYGAHGRARRWYLRPSRAACDLPVLEPSATRTVLAVPGVTEAALAARIARPPRRSSQFRLPSRGQPGREGRLRAGARAHHRCGARHRASRGSAALRPHPAGTDDAGRTSGL